MVPFGFYFSDYKYLFEYIIFFHQLETLLKFKAYQFALTRFHQLFILMKSLSDRQFQISYFILSNSFFWFILKLNIFSLNTKSSNLIKAVLMWNWNPAILISTVSIVLINCLIMCQRIFSKLLTCLN